MRRRQRNPEGGVILMDYTLRLSPAVDHSATIRGSAAFPPDHPAFDGHFPGNPILPAFLHVQIALDLLHEAGRPARLSRVESAKFVRPLRPAERISIELTLAAPGEYDVALLVGQEKCT